MLSTEVGVERVREPCDLDNQLCAAQCEAIWNMTYSQVWRFRNIPPSQTETDCGGKSKKKTSREYVVDSLGWLKFPTCRIICGVEREKQWGRDGSVVIWL